MPVQPVLAAATGGRVGEALSLWSVAPFALMLLSIALLPLVAGHLWEHNRNKAVLRCQHFYTSAIFNCGACVTGLGTIWIAARRARSSAVTRCSIWRSSAGR